MFDTTMVNSRLNPILLPTNAPTQTYMHSIGEAAYHLMGGGEQLDHEASYPFTDQTQSSSPTPKSIFMTYNKSITSEPLFGHNGEEDKRTDRGYDSPEGDFLSFPFSPPPLFSYFVLDQAESQHLPPTTHG